MSTSPTEIFAERLAVQTRQHDATDPRLIACHFTAGWLAAVDALNAKGLTQDLTPATPTPDADGWFAHRPGNPRPCAKELLVDVVFQNGTEDFGDVAGTWHWGKKCSPRAQIVKWRPARNQPIV